MTNKCTWMNLNTLKFWERSLQHWSLPSGDGGEHLVPVWRYRRNWAGIRTPQQLHTVSINSLNYRHQANTSSRLINSFLPKAVWLMIQHSELLILVLKYLSSQVPFHAVTVWHWYFSHRLLAHGHFKEDVSLQWDGGCFYSNMFSWLCCGYLWIFKLHVDPSMDRKETKVKLIEKVYIISVEWHLNKISTISKITNNNQL